MELDLSDDQVAGRRRRRRIAAYAAANPDKKWILGGGWNQEKWGLGRFPTAADLKGVADDRADLAVARSTSMPAGRTPTAMQGWPASTAASKVAAGRPGRS